LETSVNSNLIDRRVKHCGIVLHCTQQAEREDLPSKGTGPVGPLYTHSFWQLLPFALRGCSPGKSPLHMLPEASWNLGPDGFVYRAHFRWLRDNEIQDRTGPARRRPLLYASHVNWLPKISWGMPKCETAGRRSRATRTNSMPTPMSSTLPTIHSALP